MSDIIWVVVPITALLIPIVAIFASHQQRMAQIIHGKSDPDAVLALQAQVTDLQREIARQAQVLEDLRSHIRALPPAPHG